MSPLNESLHIPITSSQKPTVVTSSDWTLKDCQ